LFSQAPFRDFPLRPTHDNHAASIGHKTSDRPWKDSSVKAKEATFFFDYNPHASHNWKVSTKKILGLTLSKTGCDSYLRKSFLMDGSDDHQ
jgi:hypothetical protein